MQGKKDYQEELFSHFQLRDRVPKHNFYRPKRGISFGIFISFKSNCMWFMLIKKYRPIVFFKLFCSWLRLSVRG